MKRQLKCGFNTLKHNNEAFVLGQARACIANFPILVGWPGLGSQKIVKCECHEDP